MKFKKLTLIIFISLSMILCASSQKNIEEARKKDPQYQYNMGLLYLNEGNIEEAIRYFNKAISLNPRFDLALNSLGLAYMMIAKFQEAVKSNQGTTWDLIDNKVFSKLDLKDL